jgi:lysophospholipase L1-like esterase
MPSPLFVVCEGDSLTTGNGIALASTYPVQMSRLFTDNRMVSIINWGKSGDKISDITTEASAEVDPCFDSRKGNNVLVVWCGLNSLFKGEAGDFTAATSYGLYVTYCQARQAQGFKVVACTITPTTGASVPAGYETQRLLFNTSVRTNYKTFAGALADIGADSHLQDSTNTTYFDADLIHLTAAGYAIVAAIVQPAVASIA